MRRLFDNQENARAATTKAKADRALSVPKAAEMLSVSRSTIERMRRSGEIRTIKIRGRVIVPLSEIHRILGGE